MIIRKFVETREIVEDLKRQINTIQTMETILIEQVRSLASTVDSLASTVTTLNINMATFAANIGHLTDRVDDFKEIQTKAENLENRVSVIEIRSATNSKWLLFLSGIISTAITIAAGYIQTFKH